MVLYMNANMLHVCYIFHINILSQVPNGSKRIISACCVLYNIISWGAIILQQPQIGHILSISYYVLHENFIPAYEVLK